MLLKRLINDNKFELKLNKLKNEMKNQVSSKLENGTYKFENINCPVCGSTNKDCIGKKDRYGLYYETNICTNCGLVYTNPRMTQASKNMFKNLKK